MAKKATKSYERQVLDRINSARAQRGLTPLAWLDELARAGAIEAEYAAWATRRQIYADHTIGSQWLLGRYPDLLWGRLLATFPGGLPAMLSSHDVARLCGWSQGIVMGIGHRGRARPDHPVTGWDRSPGHASVMYGAQYDLCGVGSAPTGGGDTWTFALLGEENVG